jgi:uncharacterized RmlC-like cupin family protein
MRELCVAEKGKCINECEMFCIILCYNNLPKKSNFIHTRVGMDSFNVNMSVASWVSHGLSEMDLEESGLVECTIYPGDILYFPPFWPHATLNLDRYTTFASTFLISE